MRYKVCWYYAMRRNGQHIDDPRKGGGEYEYEAQRAEDAIRQLEAELSQRKWTQPWEVELLEAEASELLGASGFERAEVIAALRTLSVQELHQLMTEVNS